MSKERKYQVNSFTEAVGLLRDMGLRDIKFVLNGVKWTLGRNGSFQKVSKWQDEQ